VKDVLAEDKLIDFGELPPDIDALLQKGVAAYQHDPAAADRLFRQALAAGRRHLPLYFCLYKIHTYQGSLDAALAAAEAGLREAARQAGWAEDFHAWPPSPHASHPAGRFALYTLKALAFIHLRRGEREAARTALDHLARLDPSGSIGWPVVAALADGLDR
jgi:tetratricopeptide (TPR) repeat protein